MKKKVRIAQPQNNDDDCKDDNKEEPPSTYSLDEELAKNRQNALNRKTLKTPKAGKELKSKTWSHAAEQFKSQNKQKRKMTNEEKQLLRRKKQRQRQHQQQNGDNGNERDKQPRNKKRSNMEMRSSVKSIKNVLTEKQMD